MKKNTRLTPAVLTGFGLFILHVVGTIVLNFVFGADALQLMNLFGIFLGTVTLVVAIWFMFKSVVVKIILSLGALFLSIVMPIIGFVLDGMFSTTWIALFVNGIGILVLCPIALALFVYFWPAKKTTAVEEVKKDTLEPVPAPVSITDPELVRVFARTNHRLALLLELLNATDLTFDKPDANATDLFVAIEARFASLFNHFSFVDDTDKVLPLSEEHKE